MEYVAANSYLPRRNLNTAPGWAPRPHALTYAGSFAAAPRLTGWAVSVSPQVFPPGRGRSFVTPPGVFF